MPAVDSPGSPGLDFDQLTRIIGRFAASGRLIGAAAAIYDPDRDPDRRHAGPIAEALGRGFRQLA